MDLSDYLSMLRRGWTTIVAFALLGLLLAAGYLIITPKSFQSGATLLVVPTSPESIESASVGTQLAGLAAPTYAGLIRAPTVLDPVAQALRPQIGSDELASMISASQRPGTSMIDITVTGNDPEQVAQIANLVAAQARTRIPGLVGAGTRSASLTLKQITVAVPPSEVLSPSVRTVLALGLIVGLAAGVAITIVRQALDTRIRTADDIRRVDGGLLLAPVPRSPRNDPVPTGNRWGRVTERYRALRTNLAFGRNEGRRSVLIAPVRDLGTAHLVAANLAASISQTNRTVLLIDLDLRHSPLSEVFRVGTARGLGDVLTGRVTVEEAVARTGIERFDVMQAGTSEANPSDLLSSPSMGELVREMERRYDHVIVSAPPALLYTDASVVALEVRSVVLAVVAGRTKFAQLEAAVVNLRQVGVLPIGTVMVDRRLSWLSGTRVAQPRRPQRTRYRIWRSSNAPRRGGA